MIRLTWRQFRTPAVVALVALVAVAVLAAVTGSSLAHAYAATTAACRVTGDCASAMQAWARRSAKVSTRPMWPREAISRAAWPMLS